MKNLTFKEIIIILIIIFTGVFSIIYPESAASAIGFAVFSSIIIYLLVDDFFN
jgi:hypothetical protein